MRKTVKLMIGATVLLAVVLGASAAMMLGHGSAGAHQQGPKLHLADAPRDQQVEAITYCDGVYRVVTKEDAPIDYPEFDLRFKTDSGPDGPRPGTPVVIPAGMRGNRAFVVFSSPEDMTAFLKTNC